MTEIYLVGTVHIDPKGPQRLSKLLTRLGPDIVSIEYDLKRAKESVECLHFARDISKNMYDPEVQQILEEKFLSAGKNYNLEMLRTMLESSLFEYMTSLEYCSKAGKKLAFSDLFSTNKTSLIEDMFEKSEFFEYLCTKTLDEVQTEIDKIYLGRKDVFRDLELRLIESGFLPPQLDLDLPKRDRYTEQCIRNIIQTQRPKRLVHVGGLDHMKGTHVNLYERLRDLNPRVIPLHIADKL